MDKKVFILALGFFGLYLILDFFQPLSCGVSNLELVDFSGKTVYPKLSFIESARKVTGSAYLLIGLYFLFDFIYRIVMFLIFKYRKKSKEAKLGIRKSLHSLIYGVVLIFLWIIAGIIQKILGIQVL